MASNALRNTLIGGAVCGILYTAIVTSNYYSKRNFGMDRALFLSKSKGIINIGSGCDWSSSAMSFCKLPQVRANLDINISPDCPHCQYANLEDASLPFSDGEFDVAFSSHSLEHLNNWQAALTEWSRIADHLILVLPNPFSIVSYFNNLHVQHFSYDDMKNIM
jgi:SAM-dependent methyltransferase